MMDEYGIYDLQCDDLARGVIIRAGDPYDSDEGNWHMRNHIHETELIRPIAHSQTMSFPPFVWLGASN